MNSPTSGTVLHPATEADPHQIEIEMGKDRFPIMFQESDIQIGEAHFFLKLKDTDGFNGLDFSLTVNGGNTYNPAFALNGGIDGIPSATLIISPNIEAGNSWQFVITNLTGIDPEDIYLVVKYGNP